MVLYLVRLHSYNIYTINIVLRCQVRYFNFNIKLGLLFSEQKRKKNKIKKKSKVLHKMNYYIDIPVGWKIPHK